MLRYRLQVLSQVLRRKSESDLQPMVPIVRENYKAQGQSVAVKAFTVFLLLFYVGIPVWFYFCTWIRRQAVFLNYANWPPIIDLSVPSAYGLNCTRHFFVESDPGIKLGVWHILPSSVASICSETPSSLREFKDDRPVILYLHGNSETRAANYRLEIYKVLTQSKLDAHVVAFDYRGFGDSTNEKTTVKGLVRDADAMYRWLKERIPKERIYIWGHSLGSGVAVRLGEHLSRNNDNPAAIILEAPFSSVADATHTFPLSFFHRHLPFFQNFCADATRHDDTNFDSEDRIGNVTTPILFLHAADDMMVSVRLGRKLYKRALIDRPVHLAPPSFFEFDARFEYGHRHINRDANFPTIVQNFMDEAQMENKLKKPVSIMSLR